MGVEFLGIESENKKEYIKIFPNSQKWILPTRPNQKTRDISNLGIFLCLLSCFQILFPKIQLPLFSISPQTLWLMIRGTISSAKEANLLTLWRD